MKADTLTLAQQEQRAPGTDVELETRDFIVYRDRYPVTEGHTLIVSGFILAYCLPRVN